MRDTECVFEVSWTSTAVSRFRHSLSCSTAEINNSSTDCQPHDFKYRRTLRSSWEIVADMYWNQSSPWNMICSIRSMGLSSRFSRNEEAALEIYLYDTYTCNRKQWRYCCHANERSLTATDMLTGYSRSSQRCRFFFRGDVASGLLHTDMVRSSRTYKPRCSSRIIAWTDEE